LDVKLDELGQSRCLDLSLDEEKRATKETPDQRLIYVGAGIEWMIRYFPDKIATIEDSPIRQK